MKAVNIFIRIYRFQNDRTVDVLWQRKLHQDAVIFLSALSFSIVSISFFAMFFRQMNVLKLDSNFYARLHFLVDVSDARSLSPTIINASRGVIFFASKPKRELSRSAECAKQPTSRRLISYS